GAALRYVCPELLSDSEIAVTNSLSCLRQQASSKHRHCDVTVSKTPRLGAYWIPTLAAPGFRPASLGRNDGKIRRSPVTTRRRPSWRQGARLHPRPPSPAPHRPR